MIFTKVLILGRRIFKSQNFLFFFKIRNSGFVEEYLWESDNFWIKRRKRIENHHLIVHWIWKSISHCFPENYFQGGIEHTQESVVRFIEEKDTIAHFGYKWGCFLDQKILHPVWGCFFDQKIENILLSFAFEKKLIEILKWWMKCMFCH